MSILDSDTQVWVSGDIFAKYEEVLRRPRFNRSGDEIATVLRSIREKGLWVKPADRVHACSDPEDNIFLECAQAAAAHYLITGNPRHFPPHGRARKLLLLASSLTPSCRSFLVPSSCSVSGLEQG